MNIIQMIDVRWYNACADFAIKQAQALSLLGHNVMVMANPGSPPALKAKEAKLSVNEEINFSKIPATFWSVGKLRRIATQFNADILFAHRGESHLIAALAARKLRCKVVRFRGDVRSPKNDLFNRYLNEKMTDGIAVSSELLKSQYEKKFRLNGVPLEVIYPGIDEKEYKPIQNKSHLRRKFKLDPDDIVIGIVGRFSPVKGHRYFIEAAKLVSMKYPQATFVIAGGDAQISAAELQISATLLGLKKIRVLGIVDNINELMASFDIGVISSIDSEMIARVLLEYFRVGLPVVGTSVNQISELMLQSNGGILVPPADSVAMSNAIIDLISNRAKREQFALNGRSWLEKRGTLEALGETTIAFLNEALNA